MRHLCRLDRFRAAKMARLGTPYCGAYNPGIAGTDNCLLPTLEHSSVGCAAVLETGRLPLQDHKPKQSAAQSQTMWAVIRSVQAVTEDIFIRTVRPRRSVNCF